MAASLPATPKSWRQAAGREEDKPGPAPRGRRRGEEKKRREEERGETEPEFTPSRHARRAENASAPKTRNLNKSLHPKMEFKNQT